MTLKIAQSSTPEAGGYWRWSVWLEGSAGELDKVQEVTWKLHPTFSEPIKRVKSRKTKFELLASGWGEFEVHADVLRADGKKERLRHWLRLEQAKAGSPSSRSKAMTKGVKEPPSKSRPRTVFLSYTRENAKLAGSVAKQLRNDEIGTVLDIDIPAGENIARWMTEKISECDAFVIFSGKEASTWQTREIEVAKRARVALVPILFAGASQTIPDLEKFQAIQIKDGDAESIAPEIARRIQERIP